MNHHAGRLAATPTASTGATLWWLEIGIATGRFLVAGWLTQRLAAELARSTAAATEHARAGAATFEHALANFGREGDGLAGELLELVPVEMDQVEIHGVLFFEFLEHAIPFGGPFIAEFGGYPAAEGLQAFTAGAGDEGIEAEIELPARDGVEDDAKDDHVQEEPEKDLRIKRDADFHGRMRRADDDRRIIAVPDLSACNPPRAAS
jgi:hypothetical protein